MQRREFVSLLGRLRRRGRWRGAPSKRARAPRIGVPGQPAPDETLAQGCAFRERVWRSSVGTKGAACGIDFRALPATIPACLAHGYAEEPGEPSRPDVIFAYTGAGSLELRSGRNTEPSRLSSWAAATRPRIIWWAAIARPTSNLTGFANNFASQGRQSGLNCYKQAARALPGWRASSNPEFALGGGAVVGLGEVIGSGGGPDPQ